MATDRYKKIEKMCDQYDIISFDVFDTLLKRDVYTPKDVFKIIEKQYETQTGRTESHFCEKRIFAEKTARERSSFVEVTLNEIYVEIDFDVETRDVLKASELQTEKRLLHANDKMLSIYKKCLTSNKIIYIVSDMYLPEEFLEEILRENGFIGYRKLYLSSKERAIKRTGELFKHLIDKEVIDRHKILHIGDSWYSDVIGPGRVGIKGYHIERNPVNTLYLKKPTAYSPIADSALYSFINNNETKYENRLMRIGYEILGPIIYCYCKWLHDLVCEKDGIIWFAARDMYLFYKAYEAIYGKEADGTKFDYIYISRKSLRPAYAVSEKNVAKSGDCFPRDKWSLLQILKQMGYSLEDVGDISGLNINERKYLASNLIEYEELTPILNSDKLLAKELGRASIAKKYLNAKGLFDRKVILADVGWHGTTQMILAKIQRDSMCKENIEGFYIGCMKGTMEKIGNKKARSLFFNESENCMFAKGTMLFERMVAVPEGTTEGYKEIDGKVTPNLAKADDLPQAILDIQKGALKFIEEYKDSILHNIFDLCPSTIRTAFENIVEKPNKCDLVVLGDLEYDGEKLARPKKLSFYFLHPKLLYMDLKYSPWRIGFLYRLLMIPLPYAKIYTFLRSFSKKYS